MSNGGTSGPTVDAATRSVTLQLPGHGDVGLKRCLSCRHRSAIPAEGRNRRSTAGCGECCRVKEAERDSKCGHGETIPGVANRPVSQGRRGMSGAPTCVD